MGGSANASTEDVAEVLEIRELARIDGRQIWQVLLSRSSLRPGIGTLGVLRATSRSGAILDVSVTAVEQDTHGDLWHTITKPLQTGTPVIVIPPGPPDQGMALDPLS